MTLSTDMNLPEPDQPVYDARHIPDHKNKWKTLCKTYHHHWVCLQTRDGMYDGILDGTDDENVYMLVPVGTGSRITGKFRTGTVTADTSLPTVIPVVFAGSDVFLFRICF